MADSLLFVVTLISGFILTKSDPTDRTIYYQRMIKDDLIHEENSVLKLKGRNILADDEE